VLPNLNVNILVPASVVNVKQQILTDSARKTVKDYSYVVMYVVVITNAMKKIVHHVSKYVSIDAYMPSAKSSAMKYALLVVNSVVIAVNILVVQRSAPKCVIKNVVMNDVL
jgi:hypothetical protein